MYFVLYMKNILIFDLTYTVQSIIFIIISWQASYPFAFTQLIPNITCNQPPQQPVPTPCTAPNSSVSTFLPWNCFLQSYMKRVVVNRNTYIIISSILKLCDIICFLWNTFNRTSPCSSLSALIQVSILHVTAYRAVTQLHCLSNVTFLFHN